MSPVARSAFCRTHCVCVHVLVRRGYIQRADGSKRNIEPVPGTPTQASLEKSDIVSKETQSVHKPIFPSNNHTVHCYSIQGKVFNWV